MGQQQILFIVLAVIVIAIAIIVSISIFVSGTSQENRYKLTADLTNLATLAQQYYRKPVSSFGGGNSFLGWFIPPNLVSNSNGFFSAVVNKQSLLLIANGKEIGRDGDSSVKITMLVSPLKIVSVTINN